MSYPFPVMSHPPIVSVIIIFLNANDFLKESFESVLAQTYEDWELLLVDDGSSDESSEMARRFASQDLPRIRYLEHEGHQNLGMSASRNLGIRNATGRYIAFLDADDYWLPEKLETHVRLLNSHPQVGMLYGSCKYWFSWTGHPDDAKRDYVPEIRVTEHTLFAPPSLIPLFLDGKTEIPCTCSILVRLETIRNVGGFEESFRGMYEDQAFYAKICLSTPVLATGDCLAWYRQHPKSNYSTAISAGQTHALHYNFLKWLEKYCHGLKLMDTEVWRSLHRQAWLYRDPYQGKFIRLSKNKIRWIKKWILRVEERILPITIRNWLWTFK
jgi:glycosyltransferase involved in cell wall biosynthesis